MPLPSDPVPSIISIIRAFVREHGMDMSVQPVFEQGWGLASKEDDHAPSTAINRSELAFLLAGLMRRTDSTSFATFGLNYLLGMGETGELAAVAYLRDSPVNKPNMLAILGGLPGHAQLLLINRYLANPRNPVPWFRTWCYERIEILQGDDPEEVLLFLERLSEEDVSLALPLQRELLRSRFGVWLDQLLKLDLSTDQILYMSKATRPLCSHTIGANFLRFLPQADPQTSTTLIGHLSSCIRTKHERTEKMLRKKLSVDSPELQLEALKALFTIKSPARAKTVHFLYLKSPRLRRELFLYLYYLSSQEFYLFMKSLSQSERRNILHFLVDVLCLYDQPWVNDTLASLSPLYASGNDQASRAYNSLKSHVDNKQDLRPKPFFVSHPPDPGAVAPDSSQSGGFMGAMQKAVDAISSLSGSKPTVSAGMQADIDYLTGLVPKKSVRTKTFRSLPLPGQHYTEVTFESVTFGSSDFSKSYFSKCIFKNCSFDFVDFSNSLFDTCNFLNCKMHDVVFSYSKFISCKFSGCQFHLVSFSNSELTSSQFINSDFSNCSFTATHFKSNQLSCSSIAYSIFHYTFFEQTIFVGVEIIQSIFPKSFFSNFTARNTTTLACSYHDAVIFHQSSDNADFIDLERHSILEGLQDLAPEIKPTAFSPNLETPEGLKLLFLLMERWFNELDTKRRLARFMDINQRKLEWGWQMLLSSGGFFLKMLPALVESGILPQKNHKVVRVPRCSIMGYSPDLATRQLMERHVRQDVFKDIKESSSASIPIEALYTIGSIGTIAQSKGSDIDLWICYDGNRLSPEQIRSLKHKLHLIEGWAEQSLKLEVHFFVMELGDIRHNRFGFSDQESAGTAQAMLLKDEFYRSAILLAGKKPAYWLFEPDIPNKTYSSQLAKLRDANPTLFADILDMGNLEPIPKGEYFGASLWQIVKAMKSPFKSIMKIGLLDAYLSAHSSDHLLSNRLKRNVFDEMHDLWEIDPYALLFQEVFNHYRNSKRDEVLELIRLSFLQKTALSFDPAIAVEEEHIPFEHFFPYSEADIAGHIEPRRGGEKQVIKKLTTFAELAAFGNRIVKFMLSTLLTIQKQLSKLDIDLPISQGDLTKLGRKITSALAPSEKKIMRLPFVDSSSIYFTALEVSCEGMPGTPKKWFVRGDTPKNEGMKSETAAIRQDSSLERLLIWLISNNLYRSGTHVYASSVEYPLTLPDITDLLAFLYRLFPPEKVFHPDIAEYLNDEEVIAGCVIINLHSSRESKTHKTASIIYATNWGELYCLTTTRGLQQLEDQPRKFLYANIGKRLSPAADLQVFIPKKCLCPRVVLV